jgi:DNA-binding NarL/FixJ family response regulator
MVDDCEAWRKAVRRLLAECGCVEVVGESPDGHNAMQKSNELRPDLVLMDIGLPGMNGLDAARRIGVVSPGTKILFLSANSDPDVVREALRTGAGFLAKADAARDLLPLIKAIVRNEPFLRFRALGDDPSNPSEV